jgi:hypothetical protein
MTKMGKNEEIFNYIISLWYVVWVQNSGDKLENYDASKGAISF